jgi:hypothetical protein
MERAEMGFVVDKVLGRLLMGVYGILRAAC